MGYEVLVPNSALKMQQTGNYNVENAKPWLKNPDDFSTKKQLMDGHFKKITEADAILVINDEKRGLPGYIGANVLMEITLAYYLNKTIFVLHDVSPENPVYEEVMGIGVISLHGDISNIKM